VARFSKFRLLMAMLMLAAPAEAQDDDARRLRQTIEQAVIPQAGPVAGPEVASLAARMAHYHVPGLSLAVIKDGKVAFADAFGEARVGEPATPVTLFQAASLSKPVTAIAVMRLVEEGVLDLDADIRTYLRRWSLPQGAESDTHPATIRGILSHTAGFTVHGFRGYAPGEPVPGLTDILNGAAPANSPPIYVDKTPGESYRYSGGGYVVLQLLMEDVTGEPFEALMQRLVLEPMGMTRSTFAQPLDPASAGFAATAHDADGNIRPTHTYPETAPAALWTTPGDMARLLVDIAASYRDGSGVLSQASVREMATQVSAGKGPGFSGHGMGLGFAVDGAGETLQLSHGGSNKGFKSHFALWPERGAGVVMMGNADQAGKLERELFQTLGRHYGWPVGQTD
jgi:CubicO group peptidase (beta-lactamase class C family)